MEKIDFFIVGAPKCATSSLHSYLGEHPELYLPHVKDRPYFGKDITPRISMKEHLSLYNGIGSRKIIGETCVSYLYSKYAPPDIKRHNKDAKIIISLRNPVDFLYSMHSELVYANIESEKDFLKALEKEEGRKRNLKSSIVDWNERILRYSDLIRFSYYVNQYIRLFGRNRVFIIVFEEFVKNKKMIYEHILDFLEVKDTKYLPRFDRHNSNKVVISRHLQHFITHPPYKLRSFVTKLLPIQIRFSLTSQFLRLNAQERPRIKLDSELRIKLLNRFQREIFKTEKLLKRDLSIWYQ